MEQPGLELGGLSVGEEGALVGDHVDPQPEDAALVGQSHLPVHVVVTPEPGRDQVLGPGLHPLHRLSDHQRGGGRHDIAGVDGDLVAESAPDVRGHDADALLGEPRHQREHGAVCVRRL